MLVSAYNRLIGERRAREEILRLARPGDCVWDIGANVGVYTREFLDRVGPSGRVVAIEPVPEHVAQLRALALDGRLTVVAAALADAEGEMPFVVKGQESHIDDGPDAIAVRVARGDSLLGEGLWAPDLLKIDVEGFEGDVLDGMTLAIATVRGLVIEVHFAALTRRGRASEPARIVDLLRESGFSVRWLDSSHLLGTREALVAGHAA